MIYVPIAKTLLIGGLFVGIVNLLDSRLAMGQTTRPMRAADQRTIGQPRLSPYLNLLREDNSALSPYHSFVRPQRESYQQQSRQATQLQRLETQVQSQQRTGIQRTSASRLPTGNSAKFQTFLHYYQFESIQP